MSQQNDNNSNINFSDMMNVFNTFKQDTTTPPVTTINSDKNKLHNIKSLDSLVNTENLKILKQAIPFLKYENQKQLAVFVKLLELKSTITVYNDTDLIESQNLTTSGDLRKNMLNNIKEVCNAKNKRLIDILLNMMNLNNLIDSFNNNAPSNTYNNDIQYPLSTNPSDENFDNNYDNKSTNNSNTSNNTTNSHQGNDQLMNSLKSMLSPEQQTMFNMFSTLMNNNGKEQNSNE